MNDTLTTRPRMVICALQERNKDLEDEDRQIKYCKMASAPLVFYRGTNHLFWDDFASDKRLKHFGNAKTQTWLQGDLHAYNFGSYDNAQGEIVYDLNDFDETIYADYQYDLWRMAVSLVLVARQNDDLSTSQMEKVVDAFSQTYLDTLTLYRKEKKDASKTYFTQEETYGKLNRFLESVKDEYTRKEMLKKWTTKDKQDRRRFNVKKRPTKLGEASDDERERILKEMTDYRGETLNNDLAKDDAYFEVKDIVRRLAAGTGSLGTPRFYVLIEGGKHGDPDDNRILDVKRQTRPTAYKYLDKEVQRENDERYKNDGERHAKAYRLLTRHTDPHLGWMKLDDYYYSVRERSPFKEAFPCEALDTRTAFSELAEQWAEILATDHTRANEELPGLVHTLTDDQDQAFLDLVREIAFRYADQVRDDWQHFVAALELQPGECEPLPFTPPYYRNMLPR